MLGMLLATLVIGWITVEILRSVSRKRRVLSDPAPTSGAGTD
jgi:hypothetical protein